MLKFPIDAPIERVIRALEHLGFARVREGSHIAMQRQNPDGSQTPLTMPNHRRLKSSTLRATLTQASPGRSSWLPTSGLEPLAAQRRAARSRGVAARPNR